MCAARVGASTDTFAYSETTRARRCQYETFVHIPRRRIRARVSQLGCSATAGLGGSRQHLRALTVRRLPSQPVELRPEEVLPWDPS